jgi:hypothetical protein
MSDETLPPVEPPTPLLRSAELTDEVISARAETASRDAELAERFAPGIDAHLATYGMAFDALEALHQGIADGTDLDLVSDTRPAAVWQMAGRCISLGRGVLVLLRAGFTAEAVVLTRTLHEADRLLDALADDHEEELLTIWLADAGRDYVSAGDARAARERDEERLHELLKERDLPSFASTIPQSRELYDRLSQAAHNRRNWVQENVVPALRTMIRGPEPPERRAGTVEVLGHVMEEAVNSVGEALGRFYGPSLRQEKVAPLIESFYAIREASPLRGA